MSLFSEDDRAANGVEKAKQAALDREYRRQAPLVAMKLIILMKEAARRDFRSGKDVTEIRVEDGSLYPRLESSPYIPEETLKKVMISLIERFFGRKESEYQLFLSRQDDTRKESYSLHAESFRHQNEVFIRFSQPLS